MKPDVGLYIRDADLNLYQIRDSSNTHTQRPKQWLVECLKGPNAGREMWISESTLWRGDFPVSET